MLDIVDILLLLAAGCAGGFLAGLLGIGGGVIFVVVISYFLLPYEMDPHEAVKFTLANSLFATFFAGLSGTIKQIQIKNFHLRQILLTALPGVISSLIISFTIIHFQWYSKEKYGVFFMVILILFAYRMLFTKRKPEKTDLVVSDISNNKYMGTGLVSGIISALTGLGGGILIIPVLHSFMRLDIRKAASISLGIIPIFAFANSLVYMLSDHNAVISIPLSLGYIIFPVVLPLVIGVIIFAPLGVRLAYHLPQKWIRAFFGTLILILCFKMIYENFINYA
ncbi:MAG: sulfite exporter TauE/SafE family protein [Bacteroidia bacterium]